MKEQSKETSFVNEAEIERIVEFVESFASEHPEEAKYFEERLVFWRAMVAFLRKQVAEGKLDDQRAQFIEAGIMAGEQTLGTLDGLTSLLGRRAWEEQLGSTYERAMRHGLPFSLLFLDIDDFKTVNDEFGHPYGDLILKRVAGAIKSAIRKGDIAARIGGDEFGIIAISDLEGAKLIAERIRKSLFDVTMSIGLGELQPGSENIGVFCERVDRALYEGKQKKGEASEESLVVVSYFEKQ